MEEPQRVRAREAQQALGVVRWVQPPQVLVRAGPRAELPAELLVELLAVAEAEHPFCFVPSRRHSLIHQR